MTPIKTRIALLRILPVMLIVCICCDSFVDIDPPRTDLIKSTVFTSDNTAKAAMLDIYYSLNKNSFASGNLNSITYIGTLSSDEMANVSLQTDLLQVYSYEIMPVNSYVTGLWSTSYSIIYRANAILEGLAASTGMTESMKKQLEGEAKFIRAFAHFYLVNLFGDVPLVLTTDYIANTNIARSPISDVYRQIVADLLDAQNLLAADYSFSQGNRTRVNKATATAFLARVYLYMNDWSNAEAQAATVIGDNQYKLVSDPNVVFAKNSSEAIWQLENSFYPNDYLSFFSSPSLDVYTTLQPELVAAFKSNDLRIGWLGSFVKQGIQYYFPAKYKSVVPQSEYSTVFRLAEMFLIRAEARAKQNNITGAQQDINAIRKRAGLANTGASDASSLLQAIEDERRVELFSEWGHRWLDLKRTGRVDAVISAVKTDWKSDATLYPIPQSQILNSTIQQNPGY